jgi:hypothetical protein
VLRRIVARDGSKRLRVEQAREIVRVANFREEAKEAFALIAGHRR